MNSIPWRVQLGIVAAGYAGVLLLSVLLVYQRYMLYLNHPADVAAAGGMYAGGDLILALMIGCMFFVPTFLLILVIRASEIASVRYGQALLVFSFTVLITLLIFLPAVNQSSGFFGEYCLYRLFASPLVIVGLVISWLLSRFPRAKRLILYALGVEAGTLVISIAIYMFAATHH